MKREILFRGKRVDNKQWIEGFYYFNDADKSSRIINSTITMQYGHDVIFETVGQFTGPIDKNGKKIFEGDILTLCCFNGSYAHGKVVYNESSFIIIPIKKLMEGYDEIDSTMEVIGNIEDNPELLKN
jgi:uncharacterized phage protein (TIGR01671 family)